MHHADIAAFLNQKGGVGKTTSVANTGAGLAILGKRVLLVDLDPQGHLTSFLGIGDDEVGGTSWDILRGAADPEKTIVTRELKARIHRGGDDSPVSMSVIPASGGLTGARSALAGAPAREFILGRALERIEGSYDHILLDCPPSLGLISTNALAAAGRVFIPVQAEYLALQSLEELMQRIEEVMTGLNPALVIGGLIATRYDGRKVLCRDVLAGLRERYGALVLDTVIRENIALAESPRYGRDIFSYRPRSYGMEDYLDLSLEILGRTAAAGSLFSVERGVITSSGDGGRGESGPAEVPGGSNGDSGSRNDSVVVV